MEQSKFKVWGASALIEHRSGKLRDDDDDERWPHRRLGQAVMRGMAASLELEEDYFDNGLTNESFWVMRVIGYPPLKAEGSIGCGEHTDYGCLTIVNQDPNHSSLQVKDKRTGEWTCAHPVKGAFVMNIG